VSGPFQGGPEKAGIDVVIVAYRSREFLGSALDALARHAELPIDVVVVDNASGDGTVEALRREHPRVRVLANAQNAGFAGACNRGWRAGTAPLVLFLNPDAEVRPRAVPEMAARFEARPELGVVGPRTLNPDGTVQVSTGADLSLFAERRQRSLVRGVALRQPAALARADALHSRAHEPDWVSGSCLMIRRACLEAVGGFDEGFFLYEEDADLCRRVRAAGWRVLFTPAAEVAHQLGRSMERDPPRARLAYDQSHLRYYRKHNGGLAVAVLRALFLARGARAWLAGLLARSPSARAGAAELLRLALRRGSPLR
jgi:GT2 family glycosyltransferase